RQGVTVANEIKLPRLGQGMEAGTITKWLKSEGDTVAKGEPLFEIDTDKVTQEVEADYGGVLLKIELESGEAPVGQTIAWIGTQGEEIQASAPESAAAAKVSDTAAPAQKASDSKVSDTSAPEPTAEPASRREPSENGKHTPSTSVSAEAPRLKASPLARRIARERGIELSSLQGTGPDGRIVAEDVERGEAAAPKAAPAGVPSDEIESVPLTNIRKTIARRLTAAWQAPVFQLTVSADMTRANDLVARARELNPDVRVTVTDLLAKVCAQALMRHRDVNVQYADDALLRFPTVNVGIAVAAPQGLIVPVIRSVERLSLAEVAAARGQIVGRARENKLTTQDLEDGTFTISNLGMFGIEQFVAVINPPQAAILAVGATVDTPVARDGEVVVRPMLTMTLTVDHRAVDGAAGADFLRTVKQFVEEPALAL
ncbi:MAG: 2-oxo acid dehydrogenase subunit E2, partial [Actinomycetota bacterium]|nr:2-oxo acid dehydrogenase subunit E2 [Actinomycetota bacterium]